MELTGQEPRMILKLNHLHQLPVLRATANYKTTRYQLLDVIVIHFESVTMTLVNHGAAVNTLGEAALAQHTGLLAQSHSATQIPVLGTRFNLT